MKKLIVLLTAIFACMALHAQIAHQNVQEDFSSVPGWSSAKAMKNAGLITAAVSGTAWLVGNAVCVIEENKYINSKEFTSAAEILALKEEAKNMSGYKVGNIMSIAGFGGLLAGGVVAYLGMDKMKKIRNSHGQTVAMLHFGPSPLGAGVVMNF